MLASLFAIIAVVVQIGLIVHVFRTSRPIYWVFIILFFPLIGSIVYFMMELLPELSGNPRARSTMRGIRRSLDPDADLRRLENEHRLSGSVDAARHLANELIANGRFDEAIRHYHEALKGMYENDADLLLGLAEAQFGNSQFEDSKMTLERLAAENPDFKSATGHLLYARALEHCGEIAEALDEYEAVAAYYAGAEARYRYAVLLESQDRRDEAVALYNDIVATADLAPRHYRRAQKTWITRAQDGVKRLGPHL